MRRVNSLRNLFASLFPTIILIILGFWKIHVWQKYLDNDIYALNQLFFQIFAYLAIVEAGIGALVQREYYKLLIDKANDEICKYYTVSRKMLRHVCLIILSLGILVSFVIPYLANDNHIPHLYMKELFYLFLIKSLVEYFMFSPRFVIISDQKLYKINYVLNFYRILESIFETLLILYGYSFPVVLIMSIFWRILMNLRINQRVFKEYPWLKVVDDTKGIKITGMKHVLVGKIIAVAYENIDILLISTYINPLSVIIYSNYKYITKYIDDFIFMVGLSLQSSLGNILHTENDKKRLHKFELVTQLFTYIAIVLTVSLIFSINAFIYIWVGSEKLFDNISLCCIMYLFFHSIMRRPLNVLKDIFVLYKELQVNMISETILNASLSILLVRFFGIRGVLVATVIAVFATNLWFVPYKIYKTVFNLSAKKDYINYIFASAVTMSLIALSYRFYPPISRSGFFSWFITSAIYAMIVAGVVGIMYYIIFQDFRELCAIIVNTFTILFKQKNLTNKILAAISKCAFLLNLVIKLLPIQQNKILCECRPARFNDHPKAFYQYAKAQADNPFVFKWVIEKGCKPDELADDEVVYLKSFKYYYHMATSKYWLRTHSVETFIKKRPQQVYIQLWHGPGAVKKEGYDICEDNDAAVMPHAKEWDYYIATDKLSQRYIKSALHLNIPRILLGSMRTDILLNHEYDIEAIRKKLNIKPTEKMVLYTPTFRECDFEHDKIHLPIGQLVDLENIKLVLRVHPQVKDKIDMSEYPNVIDGNVFDSIFELYMASDICITDYSSCAIETVLLNKPTLYYMYDLEDYIDERNFYYDYLDNLSGPILRTQEEVIDAIEHIDELVEAYSTQYEAFNHRFNDHNDGQVCARFYNLLKSGFFDDKSKLKDIKHLDIEY